MAASPYKPTSWNSESIDIEKLRQMSSNDQWMFENISRVRYRSGTIVRDGGSKIIAGRTPYGVASTDYVDSVVYFGSFFTPGCKPVVTISLSDSSFGQRKMAMLRGLGGEIDHRGFIAHITSHEPVGVNRAIAGGGWVHWTAVGW